MTVMDTFTAIKERRAVKYYDPNFEMPEADINKLFDLAMLSPTSFNIQNWRFLYTTDKAVKKNLRDAAWNQAQVEEASMVIVICADQHAWEKEPQRYWKEAPAEVQELLVPMIAPFYQNKKKLQRDEAMRSAGIASQTIMLAAKAMGYDSCPMIGFDPDRVAEIINLPEDHVICMMLTIGKAAKAAWPHPGRIAKEEAFIKDRFK